MAFILLIHIWKTILHACYKYIGMNKEFGGSCGNSGSHRLKVPAPHFYQRKILQNKMNLKCSLITSCPPRGHLKNVFTMHK